MKFKQKDVLGLEGLSPQEINLILDTAEPMKEIMTRDIKKVPTFSSDIL
jgi:aspartate carbamoyltransferase catalytic subunit